MYQLLDGAGEAVEGATQVLDARRASVSGVSAAVEVSQPG